MFTYRNTFWFEQFKVAIRYLSVFDYNLFLIEATN